ncbi:MAG: hypothetical protein HYV09_28485 [Deltaproteobacteria bacterium]|nr:hypothetical protein [Deltaproteobacteria bacterium]
MPLVLGCTAEIPQFDDDPRPEVCGGAVCFPPDHVQVRHWGDGEVELAAWRGDRAEGEPVTCELPRAGKQPIPGMAIVVELHRPRPGARLHVVSAAQVQANAGAENDASDEPYAPVRAIRVDPLTGRALADEEGVAGEIVVLDLDSAAGRLRVRIRARWSSGISGEQVLDVEGWPACTAPLQARAA